MVGKVELKYFLQGWRFLSDMFFFGKERVGSDYINYICDNKPLDEVEKIFDNIRTKL